MKSSNPTSVTKMTENYFLLFSLRNKSEKLYSNSDYKFSKAFCMILNPTLDTVFITAAANLLLMAYHSQTTFVVIFL